MTYSYDELEALVEHLRREDLELQDKLFNSALRRIDVAVEALKYRRDLDAAYRAIVQLHNGGGSQGIEKIVAAAFEHVERDVK